MSSSFSWTTVTSSTKAQPSSNSHMSSGAGRACWALTGRHSTRLPALIGERLPAGEPAGDVTTPY
jgi:hypothetical protein